MRFGIAASVLALAAAGCGGLAREEAPQRGEADVRLVYYRWSGFSRGAILEGSTVEALELDLVRARIRTLRHSTRLPQVVLLQDEEAILSLLEAREWASLDPGRHDELREALERGPDSKRSARYGHVIPGREAGHAMVVLVVRDGNRPPEVSWRDLAPPPPALIRMIHSFLPRGIEPR